MTDSTAFAGSRSVAELKEIARHFYVWPMLSREEIESSYPILIDSAEGVRIRDVEGREFVDLMSTGSRASNLGYGDQRMTSAISEQLARLHYGGSGILLSAVTLELAKKIGELAPGRLTASVFTGSGSEANEVALKMARLYHRKRGNGRKYKVISRWDDFHGSAGSAQEASDWLGVRKPAEPGIPGFSRVPSPNRYRRPFDLEPEALGVACADYLARHIEHEGPELVSAVIIEPIAQANGVQIPPPGYLKRVREVCDAYDVVFIADEIIAGFGRTGKWFAVEHWDVEPDIMTVGKAVSAGYVPLAATIVNDEIRDAVTPFPDIHTYGGHAAAAVAALAAITIYEQDGLVQRAAELGSYLEDLLEPFKAMKAVGDVRALGLWAALDLTADRETKEPPAPETMRDIVMACRDRGIVVSQNGTSIELAPPTVISREDLADGVQKLGDALGHVCG